MAGASCGASSFLLYPKQLARVVASLLQVAKDVVHHSLWQLWRAAQYPQVFGTAASHYRIGVVGGKLKDVVVAIEGAEEAHLQLSGLTVSSGLCLADALSVWAIECLEVSAVEYLYLAIIAQGILGGASHKVTLKGVVVAGKFVPLAQVAVEVEGCNGAVVHRLLCDGCSAKTHQGE